MLEPGQILTGNLFNEPVRVVTVQPNGINIWVVGVVGTKSERFRTITLSSDDISKLTILNSTFEYTGDGGLLRLGIQALSLGIAYEFDPYFGLSISRVDPLPHQLEAVYDYLLKLARVRFLLADDAGAGKTIMAGLLLRELKLRSLAERILIVCPANLAFQWQRELKEKFDETFHVRSGRELREQYGVNLWMEEKQVITSLDLAKREDILPGLRQCQWNLVIIDEAHRMSAYAEDKKSQRYRLGELLRDSTEHLLLLTATPHRGDPANFSLFLQLLDQDAFADIRSIRQAMEQQKAPFYLRRIKEAMVHFPTRQDDGSYEAKKIFTKRIPATASFSIDDEEFELYQEVTRFVKRQSAKAAVKEADPRARAIGFLMSLYQRRLASSTRSLLRSLENRARRLEENLRNAQELTRLAPLEIPDPEEWEELEDSERERLERLTEAISLTNNEKDIREEIDELKVLAVKAEAVEKSGKEEKLSKLNSVLKEQGFFENNDERLLIFTEYRDTLDYLVGKLRDWGFNVRFIHGQMKPGSREEPGTRLYAEQEFKEGNIQILVATEAAGEGINLQACHIMFNYDIPWNPNRLEQRMGRIHRYGQMKDCLIFNFVTINTIEGRILQRLLEKLQEIRNALDDDAVFNVVGEILPATHIERVLREYYAGKFGDVDLENRVLENVNEEKFRSICKNALEGLATKSLNLEMLVERRARAKERRVVPETIARFMREAASRVPYTLQPMATFPHTFNPGPTPNEIKRYQDEPDWKLGKIVHRYTRISTDRKIAEENNLEWVTPGHPLFEALRRFTLDHSRKTFADGACFYSLKHTSPVRLDFYEARVVDGLGHTIHQTLFAIELHDDGIPMSFDPNVLNDFQPAPLFNPLPEVAELPEATEWIHSHKLQPFIAEVRKERLEEIDRIERHVEISLTELLLREDQKIGKFTDEKEKGDALAPANLAKAEERHADLMKRRQKRRDELARQRSLTLQNVRRITSVLVLPHPEAAKPEITNLRQNKETEDIAMKVAMEYEHKQGRVVIDVHEQNLGYDITSLDTKSGDLRLIEVKGLGAAEGTILLTPNEHRVAEDRRDCFWLYVVVDCSSPNPRLITEQDPASKEWHEVKKVAHYTLDVKSIGGKYQIHEPLKEFKPRTGKE
ncbi:MAG: helicase-related protein [bacterium]